MNRPAVVVNNDGKKRFIIDNVPNDCLNFLLRILPLSGFADVKTDVDSAYDALHEELSKSYRLSGYSPEIAVALKKLKFNYALYRVGAYRENDKVKSTGLVDGFKTVFNLLNVGMFRIRSSSANEADFDERVKTACNEFDEQANKNFVARSGRILQHYTKHPANCAWGLVVVLFDIFERHPYMLHEYDLYSVHFESIYPICLGSVCKPVSKE